MGSVAKCTIVLLSAVAIAAGCNNRAEATASLNAAPAGAAQANLPVHQPAVPEATPSSTVAATPNPTGDPPAVETNAKPSASAGGEIPQYDDPPTVDVGLSVEQAYAAIPHRRTVWVESDSSASPEEKAYLKVMFQVVDQGVTLRVAGLQNFSSQHFDAVNVDSEYERLILFAQGITVPPQLASYHGYIVEALSSDRRFFADWKAQGERFKLAQQIATNPGVIAASSASRAAYIELMTKYPGESKTNKEAFYDYHCALDFM